MSGCVVVFFFVCLFFFLLFVYLQMTEILSGQTGRWALFLSAFISSTLLPGGSELVLLRFVSNQPQDKWLLLIVASAGNTLGGMTSWVLGRLIAWRLPLRVPRNGHEERALARIRRWGSPVLLLSWVPVVGDPLCLAAGWLKVQWWRALLFISIGKIGRYAALLAFA